eukprot:scaffold57729_cov19-Tisochrysis_lutea.AAC.4
MNPIGGCLSNGGVLLDLLACWMLLLSIGRVNMKAVEVTTQNLISSGMDPKTENNPYLGFTYTSFQERATKLWACQSSACHLDQTGRRNQLHVLGPTSFACRVIQISHGNTARHALEYGDEVLAKICGKIAGDEGRHELAYCRMVCLREWPLPEAGSCHGTFARRHSAWFVMSKYKRACSCVCATL